VYLTRVYDSKEPETAVAEYWRVKDMGPEFKTKSSGDVVTLPVAKDYVVSFSNKLNTWVAPDNITGVEIVKGQKTELEGEYIQAWGWLAANYTFDQGWGPGGYGIAEWLISEGPVTEDYKYLKNGWNLADGTAYKVLVGYYVIEFAEYSEYNLIGGSQKFVTVTDSSTESSPVTVTGEYEIKTGSIKVNIYDNSSTADVNADGAQWRVGYESNYYNSGSSISTRVGSHTVRFTDVDGWETPEDVSVNVRENTTSTVEATYKKVWKLTVHLDEDPHGDDFVGILSQKSWNISSVGNDYKDGETVTLEEGEYQITYEFIHDDYETPPNETITLDSDTTISRTYTYIGE